MIYYTDLKYSLHSKYIPIFLYPYLLKKEFKKIMGYKLNLSNPKTLSEKIQWLKLYDATELKKKCTDKLGVREYFQEKIENGAKYLKPIYKVWDKFDDVDFSILPNKFMLKTNHAWHTHMWIFNKNELLKSTEQYNYVKKRMDYFQTIQWHLHQFEMQYKGIIPKIYAEKMLAHENQNTCTTFMDWSVFCFNSKPTYIIRHIFLKDRSAFSTTYDTNWNKLDFAFEYMPFPKKIKPPQNLDKMLEFSEILSKDFKFVRIDFNDFEGNLYLAEMTFTPYSGFIHYNSLPIISEESYNIDLELGNLLNLN